MVDIPKGQITVKIRRFIPHDDGIVILPHDGTTGHYQEWKTIEEDKANLFTNAGHDFIAQQLYATSGLSTNGANWVALSDDTVIPAVTDTVVAAEITTNGLQRSQGTYAHTIGTNVTTITKTFTATATQSSRKAGLLLASVDSTLVNENTYGPVTLNNGDQIQIIWTITA